MLLPWRPYRMAKGASRPYRAGLCLQMSTVKIGTFAENDVQDKGNVPPSPPCAESLHLRFGRTGDGLLCTQ